MLRVVSGIVVAWVVAAAVWEVSDLVVVVVDDALACGRRRRRHMVHSDEEEGEVQPKFEVGVNKREEGMGVVRNKIGKVADVVDQEASLVDDADDVGQNEDPEVEVVEVGVVVDVVESVVVGIKELVLVEIFFVVPKQHIANVMFA